MKKTYIQPETFHYDVDMENMIALSIITGDPADDSTVLSRRQKIWDDEDEEEW